MQNFLNMIWGEKVMIRNNGAEFLIETKNLETIIGNMQRKIPLCKPIMIDRILRRTLYKVKNEKGYHSSQEQIRWIRILDGDIECDGSQCCTITFKDKRKDMTEEDYALLKVDNFDDANHLFDLLQFKRTSYQENRRSKFVCKLDGVKYIVRFDIWPKIEDVVFVSINIMTSANNESINDFVNALEIVNYNICQNAKVDVDKVYEERFKYPASLIPNITFDFDLVIPQN